MRNRIVKSGVIAVVLLLLAAAALPAINDPEIDVIDGESRRQAPGQFAELTDGTTHYQLAGPRDGLSVVLVHGASVPYYIWDDTFAALANAGYRVLRYDQFGRGFSDRPDGVYDQELFQRQLFELIESLPLESPVVLAGVSMGGAIVADFATSHPQRVRGLILLDPLHRAVDIGLLAWPVIGAYLMSVSVAPGMAESQLDDFYRPDRFPEWPDRYRVQMRFKGFRRATLSIYRHYVTGDIESRYRLLAALGLPVLLIWGEHDQVVPFEQHATVRELLAAEWFPVPEAGHIPQVERPELVNPRILEFLRRWHPAKDQLEPSELQ